MNLHDMDAFLSITIADCAGFGVRRMLYPTHLSRVLLIER